MKLKKFNKWIPLQENAIVQSKMGEIYDDIEQAINGQLPIRYKDGNGIKTAIPTNIISGPSTEPWGNIEFNNGDTVKDYEIIGLVIEGQSREILPKMISVSNNSQITQVTANRISEKLEGIEFRDFQTWLGLIQQKIQTIKNQNKRKW